MLKNIKSFGSIVAVTAVYGATMLIGSAPASAMSGGKNYTANLTPLNNSGVYGTSQLNLRGRDLDVKLKATGLVPGQVHVVHIHGKLDGEDAKCPTIAQDTNHDGFVSVFEGAPKYGPIKLNLTSPQTAFGPNPNTVLFAPFAGVPKISDFPKVSAAGKLDYDNHYTFDMSKKADRQAYASLTPLSEQHIVIHGAYAPENVDTAGGSSATVYDPLLPVACGTINRVRNHDYKHSENE